MHHLDHVCVEVKSHAGGDLYRRYAVTPNALGIYLRFQIALDHGMRRPGGSAFMVASSRLVLPLPGPDMMLMANTP